MDMRLRAVAARWPSLAGAGFAFEVNRGSRLTSLQVRMVVLISALIGVSRIAALSATPWDWDEMLFSLAVEGDYDVSRHHPHPPGFPVFVAVARLLAPSMGSFHALQLVVLCGALALFPLMFVVARRMGFGFSTSVVSGVLLSSFPNVVFYGGTAFSDVPSVAIMLGGIATLLEAARSRRALFVASILCGLALGIRVQSALGFIVPGIVALRNRTMKDVGVAAVVVFSIVMTAYGGAAIATGSTDAYVDAVRHHSSYIEAVDSFHNPARPALSKVLYRVLRPYKGGDLPGIVLFFSALALIDGIVHRYRPVALAVTCFGPFLVFALLMLDVNSVSRLSTGYMPLLALLAARGIVVMGQMLSTWIVLPAPVWVTLLAGCLSVAMLVWVWPAVRVSRAFPSPPVAATDWIRSELNRDETTLWVEAATLEPVTSLGLAGWDVRPFRKWSEISLTRAEGRTGYVMIEGSHNKAFVSFSRSERTLLRLVRDRFFTVSLVPTEELLRFGGGWYDRETASGFSWRWMAGESTLTIPASARARVLELDLEFPVGRELLGVVEFTALVDGRDDDVLITRSGDFARVHLEIAPGEMSHQVELRVSRVVRPRELGVSGDVRLLGAKLVAYDLR